MEIEKTVRHLFMPGHTIYAALRLHNGQNVTEEELKFLLTKFSEINGNKVMTAGQAAEIPILRK